ncbi:IclR family transcriptional regulator [Lysinibacillus fusiformis]|uniref:IclR family transcriptional regulator n=1 Tax=Lysinibacillus sp. PWR01 TaxID=3342384 RepID=UPI00372CF51F
MSVQSIDRALQIIDILSGHSEGLNMMAITKTIHLPKSTTHRLLQSLISNGYVEQDEKTGKYSLSTKILQISTKVLKKYDFVKISKPYMEKISNFTGETVHLCVRNHDEAIYIDKVEGRHTIRMYSQIGKRVKLYCTAVGKILLSELPDKEIEDLYRGKLFNPYTENTIKTIDQLLDRIQDSRRRSFAFDNEEHEKGILCVAAPIFNHENKIIAALSLSGPIERMSKGIDQNNFINILLKTCADISKSLGCTLAWDMEVSEE